ncbi:hypothetical protein DFQ28_000622 [Apophysomyces sp. BC1034]|nr:hypothetical protein DFQ30_006768 [Apophysomyces sp. BC1015]KAG0180836.1 hypothetical protein DFQ29_010037 [Apophysomyces sp. BC1021]KAG0191283.1 hypothetical protein DFQ28_000622 [Apophysomyces sp. BC1034]
MAPGGKMYDRLKWCLENNMSRPFKMVAALIDKVSGTTLDIKWPEGVMARKKAYQTEVEFLSDIKVPTLNNLLQPKDHVSEEVWIDEAAKASEWLGLAYLKAKRLSTHDQPEPFVSIYRPPVPAVPESNGTLLRWRGFIPTTVVNSIFISLRN